MMAATGGTDEHQARLKEIVAVVQRYNPEMTDDEILEIARKQALEEDARGRESKEDVVPEEP